MRSLEEALFLENPTALWIFDFSEKSKKILDSQAIKDQLPQIHIKTANLLDVNPATLRLYEADTLEEIKEHMHQIIPFEAYDDLLKAAQAIMTVGENNEIETVNYTVKGNRLDILLKFIVVSDDLSKVILSTIDISRYKNLLRENMILARLPEANPNIVITMTCESSVTYINASGRKVLEALGEDRNEGVFKIMPPEFRQTICKDCLRNNSFAHKYKANNRDYLMNVQPFDNENQCMITISDVTEFVSLKEEKELLANVFQISNQPIIITDSSGIILKTNPALNAMYSCNQMDLIGKKTNFLNPGRQAYNDLGYSDEDYDALFKGLWDAITNPDIGFWDGVLINKDIRNNLIWVRLIISGVDYKEGKPSYYIAMPVDISKTIEKTTQSKIELYRTIAALAEMRDNETGNHMKRVGLFSKWLASEYGMNRKYCNDLEIFAPLHDIGKVGITDLILLAKRKLTAEEFEIIKNHTTFGGRILNNKEELLMAAEIANYHHEKYNGSGYPEGKIGEDIPLSARITAIADVYDALRSKRPYKEPWSHEAAVHEISSHSGTHFDPELIVVFNKIENKFKDIYKSLNDDIITL
ncbi:HD domain-containing phosphohydrolase [Petrocella sp. FN5]|uniref:HD domain-containing phosphohydrolase n=1 Tax=Petrocella sp. FN5 TaxID=3032002 RepID=UPI0023DB51D2|nr:HD domain-containing phosphohydrolase [Petrocella sp. FN5]MDF1617624.1 HD domain-containing protein [Petrocella sp. FN5]